VRRAALVGLVMLSVLVAGACRGESDDPDIDPTGTAQRPVVLTFMAYGPEEEVSAYESMVKRFNDASDGVSVSLVNVSDQDEALAQLRSGDTPDIFLLSRRDLAEITEKQLNQPIDELLDARGVDFSDLYKRDALQAFSRDAHLQCMPYGISPMVIYYNTSLIDFDAMEEEGLPVPTSEAGWTFDQFTAAAEYSSRKGIKGVYIQPSLGGLAPFIFSGGGKLFDDEHDPTSLALSSDDSISALNRTMAVLRKNRLTPTPRQLRLESALDRFTTGKLGMIAGFRSLVPELRKTPSLNFDVMPMPTLDGDKTIGDVAGLCMSAEVVSRGDAADFIVHAISTESVSEVAEAGYLVPSNNEVAESDAFLQPDQLPVSADVFNRSVRDIVVTPLIESFPRLERTVHDLIYQMFYAQVLDMEETTTAIDEASRPIINPEAAAEDN
jgi:multiple sugar transport system substrate-binding protein